MRQGQHRLIGIYIDLAARLDAAGAQRTIHVHESPGGRVICKSPNPACATNIVLNHITGPELRAILDVLYIDDAGGPAALEA